VYLDHNAAAPLDPAVRAAMREAEEDAWANPSSPNAAGRRAAARLDLARRAVADSLGVPARAVRFTSGATEANAWALRGRRVLASAVEHPSVRAWAGGTVPVDGEGRVRLDALDAAVRSGAWDLVSVMAANNETGVLQPIEEVAAVCRRHGVPLHVDAAQMPGRLPIPAVGDLMTLTSHKCGGPRGAGVLVVRGEEPTPLLRGGPQERGSRAGTEAVVPIIGLAAALCRTLPPFDPGPRDELDAAVRRLGGEVIGAGAPRLPNTCCALFSAPGDLLVMALDLAGISASTGSACSSGAARPSEVLAAMGRPGQVPVRFSLGRADRDTAGAVAALERALAALEETCGWSSP
jgi:cysteine desulfurase